MTEAKKNVIVAMSGGVDSSVAALLMKEAGHNVIGVFMRLGHEATEAEAAARAVAHKLGIKFYGINLSFQFKEEVMRYFLDTYKCGETPNPCIRCNQQIKFGVMLRLMEDLRGDMLATGHYIKKETYKKHGQEFYRIKRGRDRSKDQSYFLFTLTQERLAKIRFPVGGMEKEEVKKIAAKAGLPVLQKESQDICFLMKDGQIIDHNEFIKDKIKLVPGPIVELRSENLEVRKDVRCQMSDVSRKEFEIGTHQGLPLYTIGQRKGVELGGTGPYYVAKTDYESNILYVVKDHDDPLLYNDKFYIVDTNWIAGEVEDIFEAEVVIRYRHQPVKAAIKKIKDGVHQAVLDKPQRAVTPGQGAAVYLGDELVGGGMIKRSKP